MYDLGNTAQTLSTLKALQASGVALEVAVRSTYKEEGVAFDDIWPAIMTLCQVSEKEAMQITKRWCGY